MGKEDPPAHWRVALKWARFLGVKAVELAVILSVFASLHDRRETIIVAMAGLLYCVIRRGGIGIGSKWWRWGKLSLTWPIDGSRPRASPNRLQKACS
jgi:hypothetical protein